MLTHLSNDLEQLGQVMLEAVFDKRGLWFEDGRGREEPTGCDF